MEKARISPLQLGLMMAGFLFGSTVIVNPALSAKNDAWLSTLLGGLGGTLLIWAYAVIAQLNPSKTLVEILKEKFGKAVGGALSALYVWYFIHLAALVFRNFGEFLAATTFPETPMVVTIGILALIAAYAISGGVEVMGRLCEVFVPIIPVVSVLISFSLITTHDFTAFLPVLENGWGPVLSAAFGYVTFPFGETVAFLMLFPHLNNKVNARRAAIYPSLFMVAYSLLFVYRYICVLGGELTSQAAYASHLTSLLIPGLNLEPLIDIDLLIGGGVKISVCIYAAAKALCQLAGIGDHRPVSQAIVAFCVVLSVWVYENALEMLTWAANVWPYYSVPFQIAVPLLLFALSLLGSKSRPALPEPG